jgi:hypothetical protein
MENKLDAVILTRKTGREHFVLDNKQTNYTLINFWQWLGSDLTNNAFRGMLAEFIVACDLGLDYGIRTEWDAYDLITKEGIKVEVKSAAYLQSWQQTKLSKIEFSICPTNAWDSDSGIYNSEKKRQADVYVFALLKHLEKLTLNPLDLDQWEFYVLPTIDLNEKIPIQRKIGLNSLIKLKPVQVKFGEINKAINNFF